MRIGHGRLTVLVALVAVVAVALPAPGGAAGECKGIKTCIPVQGPWVAVPASGEARFLLSCPRGQGIVAGADAVASSRDVHATFDANIASPIKYGLVTGSAAFFRAVSGKHKDGVFRPLIGCIPDPQALRNTVAAKPQPIGPPLVLRSTLERVGPGTADALAFGCEKGEILVDSWTAKMFGTEAPPAPSLARTLTVHTTTDGNRVIVEIRASLSLPDAAAAAVQVGVRCARA